MAIGLHYHNQDTIFTEVEGSVPHLEIPMFQELGFVKHGFSTRLGGVSEGCFTSMNLSFTRGDEPEAVRENFRRFAQAIGVRVEDMVFTQQTHTTCVRYVTEQDCGRGITRELGYQDVDGLVTDVPGVCLVTFYADCVPLYFVDPIRRVIGLSHSGWRGTVSRMGAATVKAMVELGSRPEDILAVVGPSICQDCYEVSEDVIEQFRLEFPREKWETLFYQKENGKYQLNLWKANEQILLDAGITKEHLRVTNVCTHCNSEVLFSHRAMGNQRGNLAAFLTLEKRVS